MSKQSLFQYAILWHPNEKQVKDEGKKSLVLVPVNTIMAKDLQGAIMAAAMEIPPANKGELDQIEIAVRPF